MNRSESTPSWLSSWPDALAFAVGLAVAWWARWDSGDLVWSLWLSSLVVGYATILWMIGQPAAALLRAAWLDQARLNASPRMLLILGGLVLGGTLFFVAFFTFHFGFFHYVHSQILVSFFPIDTGHGRPTDAGMATYAEIGRRYWIFLPSAFLAHRAAFLRRPLSLEKGTSLASVAQNNKLGALFSEPYRNVGRMHLLLFFFFFAHFAKLENFVIYAVVYAAYFFPWRLIRRDQSQSITDGRTSAIAQSIR